MTDPITLVKLYLRECKRLTYKQVADRADLSYGTLRNVLGGFQPPTSHVRMRLAAAFPELIEILYTAPVHEMYPIIDRAGYLDRQLAAIMQEIKESET